MKLSTSEKKGLIDPDHPSLSVTRQCELLNLSKGAYYYSAVEIDPFDLQIMDEIDRIFTKTPFYGSRRITVSLRKLDYAVNRKRIQRLMRVMGLEAIYPKGNLSKRNQAHKIYPYLLTLQRHLFQYFHIINLFLPMGEVGPVVSCLYPLHKLQRCKGVEFPQGQYDFQEYFKLR